MLVSSPCHGRVAGSGRRLHLHRPAQGPRPVCRASSNGVNGTTSSEVTSSSSSSSSSPDAATNPTTSSPTATLTSTTPATSSSSSSSFTAPPTPSPQAAAAAAGAVTRAKLALLSEIAGLNRGALATPAQKQAVAACVAALEGAAASPPAPFTGSPAAVEGRWELLYANTEGFRSSPFFLAFASLVGAAGGSPAVSDAIFAFTDAIPGASIGSAYQFVSLLTGRLISEVDMEVWPGLKGTVVTTCTASPLPPASLELQVLNTRVHNSAFSPFLDNVVVPVDDLMGRLAGPQVTRAVYDITYLDEELRVTRAGEQLLVHRRVL